MPKNDIRRTYAKIFADCFNSGDFESLGRKLKDFCTDDCVCSDECKGPKRNPYLPPKVDIIGVEALMRYWGGMGCVMPDSVVTLHEAKIKVTTDSCRIVNSYTMVGTIMYDAYLVHNEFVDVNLDKKISLAIENNDNQTVGHSSEHDNGSTTNESDHGSSNTFEDGSSKKRRRLLQDSDELLLDSDPEIRESAALTTVTSTLSNVGQIVTTFAPINNGEDIVDGKRKKQTVVVLSDPTLPNAVVYPTSTIEISQNLSSMAGKITIKGSVTLHIDKQNNIFKIQGEYAIQ